MSDIRLTSRFVVSRPDRNRIPTIRIVRNGEFYHVISGTGSVRHKDGTTAIEAGDTFIFRPDEPHQLFADSADDLVLYVVADNPGRRVLLLSRQQQMARPLARAQTDALRVVGLFRW